jgi:hypothetical protein
MGSIGSKLLNPVIDHITDVRVPPAINCK